MKLHKNLTWAAAEALTEIFERGHVADRVVERYLQSNPKWGKRDRDFVSETIYNVVRWRRRLASDQHFDDPWHLIAADLVRRHPEAPELPDWPEWSGLEGSHLAARYDSPDLTRAERESVPDWLDAHGEGELGDRWAGELAALNMAAPVILRANTLKTTRDSLARRLAGEGVETGTVTGGLPDALQLKARRNVVRLAAHQDGWFEVQDGASQLVAPLLGVEAGMRVIDACAGAGGKTLHLAALMQNRGQLLALDVNGAKLQELERRAERAGARVQALAVTKPVLKSHRGWANRLLLDMPCSGTGTLRRQPDLKWRLTPDFLARVHALQRDILAQYSALLAPGGRLVYATCSILPSENEEQVRWLVEQGNHRIVQEKRIWPSEGNWDGFYMALLESKPG